MVMPLVGDNPNPKDLKNWLPYPYVGLLSLALAGIYWLCMFEAGPRLFSYHLIPEETKLDDGLVITQWSKIYNNRFG